MTYLDTMESINSTSTRRTYATVKPGYEDNYGDISEMRSAASSRRSKAGAKVSVVSLIDTAAKAVSDSKEDYAEVNPFTWDFLVVVQFRVLGFQSSEEGVATMKKFAVQKPLCQVWLLQYDTDIHCFRANAMCRYSKMTTWKIPYQAPIMGVHPGRANPLVQITPHVPREERD